VRTQNQPEPDGANADARRQDATYAHIRVMPVQQALIDADEVVGAEAIAAGDPISYPRVHGIGPEGADEFWQM
jgi:hypothetical protein